ncbi:unnamed protein product [Rotaria sp. Silwood2]|nr:unnamed protein product [Rotaria sp. Silwood2]CAF3297615.1 unnamed protein product [Rotaria sp. Silwood2]CAF4536564.1 unnamed protein product [Rotaria sp. Silwood2]CAF4552652.1 unnamed protein product [Rotaria sp. Silwood2]CAF4639804.1 unnamed protein product [Rotaria sp. Silwood2]
MSDTQSSSIPSTSKGSKNRQINKQQKENLYQSLFPPYVHLHQHSIFFINNLITLDEINHLIKFASTTTRFIFDTEADKYTNAPAIIQIYFMNDVNVESPMLLIEIKFIESLSSAHRQQLQQLFNKIFRYDSHIYTWGPLLFELFPFLEYGLFTYPILSYIHNAQVRFTSWFNNWLNTATLNSNDTADDPTDSIILHAPSIDPSLFIPAQLMNNKKLLLNELWSLQDAIAYIFNQYLSKQYTLRKWSIGLDVRLPNRDPQISSSYRRTLVKYAIYDCLSMAQLLLFISNSNISSNTTCIKYFNDPPLGEYKLIPDISDPLSLFQVHSTNDLSIKISNDDNEIINQDEVNNDVEIIDDIECNNNNNNIEIISDDDDGDLVMTGHEINDRHQTLPNIKSKFNKRSTAARRRRNIKSSLRHRKNRYNFVIVRSIYTNITNVKKLLKSWHIKYTNVNNIRSTLYIGMSNQGDKQLFEQLIPDGVFI